MSAIHELKPCGQCPICPWVARCPPQAGQRPGERLQAWVTGSVPSRCCSAISARQSRCFRCCTPGTGPLPCSGPAGLARCLVGLPVKLVARVRAAGWPFGGELVDLRRYDPEPAGEDRGPVPDQHAAPDGQGGGDEMRDRPCRVVVRPRIRTALRFLVGQRLLQTLCPDRAISTVGELLRPVPIQPVEIPGTVALIAPRAGHECTQIK